MKQIIKQWMLAVSIMMVHTQVILANEVTEVTTENMHLGGWMFMGAGIAICLAVVLFFFLNKLFKNTALQSTQKGQTKIKKDKKSVKVKPQNVQSVAHKSQGSSKKVTEPAMKKTAPVQVELMRLSEPIKNIKINLNNHIILGRNAQKAHVIIDDDQAVSGAHCKLYLFDEKVYIMDLGSTNGTYVNGNKIEYAVVLKPGDLLEIGSKEYCMAW